MIRSAMVFGVMTLLVPGGVAAQDHAGHSAHSGKETREIKALSQEEVRALLEGDGAGYALAAERNQHPGPRHALDLAQVLSLTPHQVEGISQIFQEMNGRARELGHLLVDQERELDRAFRDRSMTADRLQELLGSMARLQAELRYVHLDAHLRTTALLTTEQVQRYDQERGYQSRDGT